jgi:RNA polymerase primary sigma factor
MTDHLSQYFCRLRQCRMKPDAEAETLLKKSRAGVALAFQELVLSYLGYVATIAYHNFEPRGVLDKLDLIQEANIALIEALRRCDCGAPLQRAYIKIAVKNRLCDVLRRESRGAHLSTSALQQLSLLAKTERTWRARHGEDPSIEELAEASGISAEQIRKLFNAAQPPIPLDADEIKEAILDNSLIDPAPSPDKSVELDEIRDKLSEVLSTLNELERIVLVHRYGLGTEGIQNAAVLARRFKTSANKINEIEDRAIQHLRHPQRAGRLSEFLN